MHKLMPDATGSPRSEQNGYSYHLRESEHAATRRAEPPGASALLPMWQALDVDGNGRLSALEAAGITQMLHVNWDVEEAWAEAIELFEVKERVAQGEHHGLRRTLSGRDGFKEQLTEISFGSFVQLYNLRMGAQRRQLRVDVKALFEKLDANHSGTLNKQQLAILVRRCKKQLGLLPPEFELERDWGYLTSDSPPTDLDNPSLGVSWKEFERWWKNRCGLTEADTPIIPEYFTRQLKDNTICPHADLAKYNRKRRPLETSLGTDLWAHLAPKLKKLAAMKRIWVSDKDMYAHSESAFGDQPIPPGIRDPESSFSVVWDLLQIVFLLYVSVTVPYRACFEVEVELFSFTWFWDTMIDIYFICDMILNFRTAYVDSKGVREVNPKTIAKNYVTGWFALDFISCVPVGHISTIIEHRARADGGLQGEAGADNMRALKAIRLLRMSKMLRLARIKRILQKYESLMIVQEYMGIGFMVCTVVFVAHFLTCMWYLVGLSDESVVSGRGLELGRRDVWAEPRGTTVKSWVNEQPWFKYNSTEFTVSTGTRYITSMYFVFNALDDAGHTDNEKVMGVVALVCTIIIKGAVAGLMSSLLVSMSGKDNEVNDMLRAIKAWLIRVRVPRRVMKHTLEYFVQYYKTYSMTGDAEALASMPPSMGEEFRRHIYTKHLQGVPMFRGLSSQILAAIATALTPMKAMKGQIIFEEGSVGGELYMVMDGEFEATQGRERLGFLSDGSFFGEVPVLDESSNGVERTRTVTSVTESNLCYISTASIRKLREHYPELELIFRRFARGGTKPTTGRTKGRKAEQARQIKQALMTEKLDQMASLPMSRRRTVASNTRPSQASGDRYSDISGTFLAMEAAVERGSGLAVARACDSFQVKLDALARRK